MFRAMVGVLLLAESGGDILIRPCYGELLEYEESHQSTQMGRAQMRRMPEKNVGEEK